MRYQNMNQPRVGDVVELNSTRSADVPEGFTHSIITEIEPRDNACPLVHLARPHMRVNSICGGRDRGPAIMVEQYPVEINVLVEHYEVKHSGYDKIDNRDSERARALIADGHKTTFETLADRS